MGKKRADEGEEDGDVDATRPRRQSSSARKKYTIDSDDDDAQDDASECDMTSKRGKVGVGIGEKNHDKASHSKKQEEELSDIGSDDEVRLMNILSQSGAGWGGSATASPSKVSAAHLTSPIASKSGHAAGTSNQIAGTKPNLGRPSNTGKETRENEDDTASGKPECGSKIKFSRSIQLMVPNTKRISRGTFLLQCDDPALDFEGDSGVIGTIKTTDSSIQFDIKGQLYEGSILPSSTMMVVDMGATEGRIEAIMSDFVQLRAIANPHGEDMDVEDSEYDMDDGSDEEPKPKKSKTAKTDASSKKGDKKRKSGAKGSIKQAGKKVSKNSSAKKAAKKN